MHLFLQPKEEERRKINTHLRNVLQRGGEHIKKNEVFYLIQVTPLPKGCSRIIKVPKIGNKID